MEVIVADGTSVLLNGCYEAYQRIHQLLDAYSNRFANHKSLADSIISQQQITRGVLQNSFAKLGTASVIDSATTEKLEALQASLVAHLQGTVTELEVWEKKLNTEKPLGRIIEGIHFASEGERKLTAMLQDAQKRHADLSTNLLLLTQMETYENVSGNSRKIDGVSKGVDGLSDKVDHLTQLVEHFVLAGPSYVRPAIVRYDERITMAKARWQRIWEKERTLMPLEFEQSLRFIQIAKIDGDSEKSIEHVESSYHVLEEDSDRDYGVQVRVIQNSSSEYDDCLVDYRSYLQNDDYKDVRRDSVYLATLLSDEDIMADDGAKVDEEIGGLLRCHGVVKRNIPQRFELIFRLPLRTDPRPRSLRKVLTDPCGPQHPINDRVRLALLLAQALFLVHVAGIVHKNIRPESILITEPYEQSEAEAYPKRLGTPYLFAFEHARSNEGITRRISNTGQPSRRSAYRPPLQQGLKRIDRYRMPDDIYSLGVCLLEIGMWKSFFKWDGKTYVEDEEVFKFRNDARDYLTARRVQEKFVHLAREEIPKTMGRGYAEVVINCLNWPDVKIGKIDADKITVQKFAELVMERLRKLSSSL